MITRFPVAMLIKGRVWFGGDVYKSPEDAAATLTDTERRRHDDWSARNADQIGKRCTLTNAFRTEVVA